MSNQASPTIVTRLVLLVFAAVAPAVVITGGLLGNDFAEDRKRLEENSIATARAMVHAIDRELVAITAAAQVLATSNRAQAGDLQGFYPQAEQVAALRIGRNVVLSDTDGRQLLNTLRKPGEPLPMHGNLAQLRRVVQTRQPLVSDLYIGGVLERPVVSVDVPVLRNGEAAYVLSIGALPERFSAILSTQRLPAGWIGAVFDRSGTIVARTHEHERFVGQKGARELVERMAQEREGALEATTLEGIRVDSVFSRSAETGWTVALGIPRESLVHQLTERTLLAAIAALVSLTIGVLLARWVAGSIARSIRGLVAPAGRIGEGQRVVVPRLGLKEADEVGHAITRASDLILSAEFRAGHDVLTGLPNRAQFLELAARHLETCRKDGGHAAVLFIDLDSFKQVNDAQGHDAGDSLLKAVALRIRNGVRAADIPSRLGGDEFAILLKHTDARVAAEVAAKLHQTLSGTYELPAGNVTLSASIGVAACPDGGTDVEALLRKADRAMYEAKSAGKGNFALPVQ
ncbi:MAG TPA: diguanylate cyclase [Burkholderiales bacterium]|nr:diguanylate cyclase [Burkholderiales bacterium]